MDTLLQDVRYAVRSITRSKTVFLLAAASLALGVGANTTIFSAVDVFLFRPLPYPDSDALVRVYTTNEERGWTEASVAMADFVDWRERSSTLDIAAFQGAGFNLSDGDRPERVNGARVATNFFGVMQAPLLYGRGFREDEELRGSDGVIVISESLWQRKFGARDDILGAVVELDGVSRTIVGVAAHEFEYPSRATEVWAPLGRTGEEPRLSRSFSVIARLRDGASIEAARADMDRIAAELEREYIEDVNLGASVMPLRDDLFNADFWTASMIVTFATVFVLLIACANIANLLLAKAAGRDREIAVRTVLGAGRLRILRQLLTESLLLGLVGGALGLLLAVFGIRWLVAAMPPNFMFLEHIGIDARVLGYTLAVAVLSGLIFGIAPALHALRPDLNGALRDAGTRGSTVGLRRGRFRAGLVVAEVGLALTLFISAGLLVRGYSTLRNAEYGFDTEGILAARVALDTETYPDSARIIAFYDALRERLGREPGVRSVGLASSLPLQGGSGTYYSVTDNPAPPDQRPVAQFRVITPGFLETMGVEIVDGRGLTSQDRMGSAPVMLVNESFAAQNWPNGGAVGRFVELSSGTYEVVGIAGDMLEYGGDEQAPATMFLASGQRWGPSMAVVLRAEEPGVGASAVREAVSAIDPNLPVYSMQSMQEIVADDAAGDRILNQLLVIFAGIALGLAILGVYGVMAYNVAQRRREVGIRMALGAGKQQIVRLVVRQGSVLAGIGLLAGLGLALAVSRNLASFLYGVSPFDPATFALATVSLGLAAVLASYVPARRATRVDPVDALRTD